MSGWLTALRIARREARRAKGRSTLVIALIGLPVAALSIAPARPTADLVRELLPETSQLTTRWRGDVRVSTATGVGTLPAEAFHPADPLLRGIVTLTDGRAPAAGHEVVPTAPAVTRLGAAIGDEIALVEAPGSVHPGSGRRQPVGAARPGAEPVRRDRRARHRAGTGGRAQRRGRGTDRPQPAVREHLALTGPDPIIVPWLNLAVLLVAMLGAGLLTRSRLPIERRT